MANLVLTEAPGGLGDCYQCPHCGLMSLTKRLDDQGIPTEQDADPPRTCRRCGSPMDLDASQKFQDEQASAAPPVKAGVVRARTVKV